MPRVLVLAIVVTLGVVVLPIATAQGAALPVDRIRPQWNPYRMCAYLGDPHLVPFSQHNKQYWCQNPGWELLLSNQYVTLYVLVDQDPHQIIDVRNRSTLRVLSVDHFIIDIPSSTC